jgi:hypothetical protein
MNLSSEEAESSLVDIDRMVARTRRAIVAGHGANQLILWGILWMIGFGAGHFSQINRGLIWMPIGLVGGALSWWIGFRDPRPVQSPAVGRIGWVFLALLGFAVIWAVILHPFNHRHLAAYFATVFMFPYVVGGLWFGRFFVLLGLGVAGAALIGVFFLSRWLDLWMAVAGGGSLVVSGLYIRRAWK